MTEFTALLKEIDSNEVYEHFQEGIVDAVRQSALEQLKAKYSDSLGERASLMRFIEQKGDLGNLLVGIAAFDIEMPSPRRQVWSGCIEAMKFVGVKANINPQSELNTRTLEYVAMELSDAEKRTKLLTNPIKPPDVRWPQLLKDWGPPFVIATVCLGMHLPFASKVLAAPQRQSVSSVKADASEWSYEKGIRRCQLIDKKIQDRLSAVEGLELEQLQTQFRSHLDSVAPIDLDGARRLHRQLLEKMRQSKN